MDTLTEFYIVLGKIFVVVLVGIFVAIVLYMLGRWLDKSDEEPKQTKPIDGISWLDFNTYDSEGRIKQKGDGLRGLSKGGVERMKYNVGDKVIHNKWGKGVIVHADDSGVPYGCEFENETDNNFSFNGKGKEGYCAWCEEKDLKLAETKLYAYDLMKLAHDNPQEYEGRRYRTVRGIITTCCPKAEEPKVVKISNGYLMAQGTELGGQAYVSVDTRLEEIKPEPKPVPVPFLEAVKANENGKVIKCHIKNDIYVYDCFANADTGGYGFLQTKSGHIVTFREILDGTWYITE